MFTIRWTFLNSADHPLALRLDTKQVCALALSVISLPKDSVLESNDQQA